jgi:hypothetical protein
MHLDEEVLMQWFAKMLGGFQTSTESEHENLITPKIVCHEEIVSSKDVTSYSASFKVQMVINCPHQREADWTGNTTYLAKAASTAIDNCAGSEICVAWTCRGACVLYAPIPG